MAAMLIQIVPLPRAIVAVLSPHADEVRGLLRFQPLVASHWTQLSLDASKTADALAIVALADNELLGGPGRLQFRRQHAAVLPRAGGGWAAAAAISAADLPRRFAGLVNGMLRPESRSAYPFGAFVNRNHFAGWLLLVAGTDLRLPDRAPAHSSGLSPALSQRLETVPGIGAMLTAMAAAATSLACCS
jgi:hypothetical protein